MRDYDPQSPLIFIHVPKTAGIAVQAIVKKWFSRSYHEHYFDDKKGRMPKRLSPRVLNKKTRPPLIYGHFNKLRNFGVQDYYPTVSQFVTILRDPYEMAISTYFYVRKQGPNHWLYQSCQVSLEDYVKNKKSRMLNHFPREMNISNFREFLEKDFIEIGITEMLPKSLERIAGKLNKKFDPSSLLRVNVTERDTSLSDSHRDLFVDAHPLEFAIYEYARSRFVTAKRAEMTLSQGRAPTTAQTEKV